MITGLGHTAVRAADIRASVRYYTEVLGLTEAFRMYGDDGALATVYLYIAPGQFLELFANGTAKKDGSGDEAGLCHICLVTDDIGRAYLSVRDRGGPVDTPVKRGASRCLLFWTHDPDGNQVEIMQTVPGSLQDEADRRLSGRG